MKTLFTVGILALTLVGCNATPSRHVATNATGGRGNDVRIYSLTGEQTQVAAKDQVRYQTGQRTLPRPN